MSQLVPEENQEEVTRIALRLYEADRQVEEKDRQQQAAQSAFEEIGIPPAYLERAAEVLNAERAAQAALKERRSQAIGTRIGLALGIPLLGLLIYLALPLWTGTLAWWRTPAQTGQQSGTLLGRWKKMAGETPVAEWRDATLEFLPNGAMLLQTPQQRAYRGLYGTDAKQVTTFSFPEYRGTVLASSNQEMRLLLHYNTYWFWGAKSGEAESVLTWERERQRSWEERLLLALLVGGSGIVGLVAMVQGATTATRSPGKLFLTCSGVGIGLVGAALLARYTHFVWAGPPLTIAALGFGYGFLGKRLQVQEPTEQASVEATEQS